MNNPDEINDDLGLSPDYKEDFSDQGEVDIEGENSREMGNRGEGIYYSITNDNPVGPFPTLQEAKQDLEKHVAMILKQDKDSQNDGRFWFENSRFFEAYASGGQLTADGIGNYYSAIS